MDDMISRQQAIDALMDEFKRVPTTAIRAKNRIERLPSAQLEIIRCKDCKYAEYIDDVQSLWCTECGQGRTVAPYDFCSYADRRE